MRDWRCGVADLAGAADCGATESGKADCGDDGTAVLRCCESGERRLGGALPECGKNRAGMGRKPHHIAAKMFSFR